MPHWKFKIKLLCVLDAKLRDITDGRIDVREAVLEKTLLVGHVELVDAELVAILEQPRLLTLDPVIVHLLRSGTGEVERLMI